MRDLAVALTAAWLAGIVAARLRLNPMLGYLAAGVVIGPFTPGYVAHAGLIEGLATLGLIFLLFSLGLEFSFEDLRELGARSIAGNFAALAVVTAVAYGLMTGLHLPHAMTVALTTTVSSTAVGVALLRDWNRENDPAGRFAIAQQVVQDLVAVVLLVITTAPADAIGISDLALPLLKVVAFVGVAFAAGHTVLKRVVRRTLGGASTDRLFIAFASLALIAAWMGELAGLSFEFGAFVAGAVISEAAGSKMIVSIIAPFRAIFVALFFVSIGMLVDPSALGVQWFTILAVGLTLFAARAAVWAVLAATSRLDASAIVAVALAMTSLGEFNVVLVTQAFAAQRISTDERQLLLGITLFTMICSFIVSPLAKRLMGLLASRRQDSADAEVVEVPPVTIIGYGRVGRVVGRVLRDANVAYIALESDRRLLRRGSDDAAKIVFGDALDPAALDRVIGPNTRIVLTTVPVSIVNLSLK